jgi:ABC-type lipoprotein export system ATPase subunit
VTVTASPGDVVAVEGPNGSGKSTLLAAAAGLLPSGPASRRPASVGYAPERADVLPRLSVRHWLTGLARTAGLSRAESARQADDLIQRLGLTQAVGTPLHALSRGNAQRALVAQAFIGPPELVVLDEPSGGLDGDGVRRVTEEIEQAAARSCVVLVARHPTAKLPLPPGPTWRVSQGAVRRDDREGQAVSWTEVETADGVVRQVSQDDLASVLRAALDAGIGIRLVRPVTGSAGDAAPARPARPAGTAVAPRRSGEGRRLLNGATHRARLLAVSQWFAAPALLYLVLLAVMYGPRPVPRPPPLVTPALGAVVLLPVMTWLTVLAHTVDGRVVGRAFGAHVGGPGRAHLAASLAAVPFGILAALAGLAWPVLTNQAGHLPSAAFLGEVIALGLGAAAFGIGIGALLVPPLVLNTGWRVCLGVSVYLALVLIPVSPVRPLLRLSVGSLVTGGAALTAAGLLAGTGAVLIAVTAWLARRLP